MTNTCIVLSFGCLVKSATPGTPSMNFPPLLGIGPLPLLPLLPLLLPSRASGSPSSSTVGSWGAARLLKLPNGGAPHLLEAPVRQLRGWRSVLLVGISLVKIL